MPQIDWVVETPFEMFAVSFSQGTATFTATEGLKINPNESAMAWGTKVVAKQGLNQLTIYDLMSVCVPIVVISSIKY